MCRQRTGVHGPDADVVLGARHVDAELVSVASSMPDMAEHIERCVRHGVNVVTRAEEVLVPWRTQPVIASGSTA